eukprot:Cvel_34238.t1-p1 / transcript=Cvel_34238.t1 / gene=Cvel_34238 / organism=Chromera_velia_CCMP2878 / gene_product=Putative amidase AmiB2, putative / transcript_product=Putative amidase AmiB2, putative / location=Cvel_scaffold5807:3234-3499(+) / protein_length=88 / sequence_SO=supercontig / SO=protein_coding / is_pseudo=false
MALWKKSASECVRLLSEGAVTASALLETAIDRIRETDSDVNAVPVHAFDRARARVAEIDSESQTRKAVREGTLLKGLPVLVKDEVDLR